MFQKVTQAAILSVVVLIGFGTCESTVFAQGDLGIPTGDTGGQTAAPQQVVNPSDRGANVSGVGEGIGPIGQTVELDPFNVEPTDDTRNQGFVGATATRIQESGFIGRPGELIAPPLAEGALLAGGVNGSSNSTVSIGGGGTAGRGGAGFGAATNGITITRRSMRSTVRPSFYAPQLTAQQVTTRFGNHFRLQPGPQSPAGSYTINVQDKTATLNGSVNTRAESDHLVRQLRLEPGVYKIVNQLRILN